MLFRSAKAEKALADAQAILAKAAEENDGAGRDLTAEEQTEFDRLNASADKAIADRLAGLGKPVLVIWGERDVLTPTAGNVARYTEAGLPPHVIAGSGHSPMVEKPDEFVSAIKDFVS